MGFMNMVINKEIKLFPVGESGYRIYGKTFEIKDELKNIGAIWNKERKAFELSKESFSKLNFELRDFIIKNILQGKVESVRVISNLILNDDIKLYLKDDIYKVYGKTKPIYKDLLNAGFKFENGNYQISVSSFNAEFRDDIREKVGAVNAKQEATSEEIEI